MKKKQTEILEPIYNINGKQNKQLSGWLNGRKKRAEEKSKKVENLNSRNYPIFTTERKKIEKKKKKEQSLRDMGDYDKRLTFMSLKPRKKGEKGWTEKLFKEIMADNSPKFGKT